MSSQGATWRKPVMLASYALSWASAAAVLGITAWFISQIEKGHDDRSNILYMVAIAAATTVVIPIVVVTSLSTIDTGGLVTLNVVYSHLWLISFVLAAQDWARDDCESNLPVDACGYKHAVVALTFISFFTMLLNTFLDTHCSGVKRTRTANDVEK